MTTLRRWIDLARAAPSGSGDEHEAGRMFRDAEALPPLARADTVRIEARVRALGQRRRTRLWRWQLSTAALILLGAVGLAAATVTTLVVVRRRVGPPKTEMGEGPERRRPQARSGKPAHSFSLPGLPNPNLREPVTSGPLPGPDHTLPNRPEPPPATLAPEARTDAGRAAPKRTRATTSVRPGEVVDRDDVAFAGPPPPSNLSAESKAFAAALQKLRIERDSGGALSMLDDYQERFPHGSYLVEALLARVEALQALHQLDEARALLEGTALGPLPRARELHVLRGELRAASDRCFEAIADFEEVLARGNHDTVAARALRGLAVCRQRIHGGPPERVNPRPDGGG